MNNKQTLSLSFSPCPNDTFIFDSLIHGKIDTDGLLFTENLLDVEELNKRAFNELSDITKLSIFAYAKVADKYQILDAGSALGTKNGPLLISKKKLDVYNLDKYKIAIPGKHTTANFLLSALYPTVVNKVEMLFSDIETAIENETVDAGVIIHETRFTYQQKGLIKALDLGQRWERKTGLPIPLGCIAIKRSLPNEIKIKVNTLIRKSIEQAFIHPEGALPYCKLFAQDMNHEVMLRHIILYVNNYSLTLNDKGKEAITTLYEYATALGLLEKMPEDIFSIIE
jgi:1,4-dihydroxy-6-naphthoate synthase